MLAPDEDEPTLVVSEVLAPAAKEAAGVLVLVPLEMFKDGVLVWIA